jgi:PAS domain S-box-containing protein
MSGWAREELIGAPHHILRHPDMPKIAFKGLWDDIAAGKKWHGYVKNLRKDGAFYWVYATAVPQYPQRCDRGLHLGAPQALSHAHQ